MSTHNIGFYEEISKIIPELSSNKHFISSAAQSEELGQPGHLFSLIRVLCSHEES